VWPGIDGYENAFGVDLRGARDRFAEGLAEAMDAVPGVRVAENPSHTSRVGISCMARRSRVSCLG